MGTKHVAKFIMATPFKDPRTGMLYLRRGVPEGLRPAFEGRSIFKVSLRTKDAADARAVFTIENAKFEDRLKDARRQLAEGTLAPTPVALIRRWTNASGIGQALSGSQKLSALLMELDAAVPATVSCVSRHS
jgi:hypothetical protein